MSVEEPNETPGDGTEHVLWQYNGYSDNLEALMYAFGGTDGADPNWQGPNIRQAAPAAWEETNRIPIDVYNSDIADWERVPYDGYIVKTEDGHFSVRPNT